MNRFLFGLKIQDSQVGIKMFKKEVIQSILPSLTVKRFAIDLEILVAANEQGFTILEAPVQINESFSSTVNAKAIKQIIQEITPVYNTDAGEWRYKFKLMSKDKAVELLGKHVGAFTENINLTGDVNINTFSDMVNKVVGETEGFLRRERGEVLKDRINAV